MCATRDSWLSGRPALEHSWPSAADQFDGDAAPVPFLAIAAEALALVTSLGWGRCSTGSESGVSMRSRRQRAAIAAMPELSGLTEVRDTCRMAATKVSSYPVTARSSGMIRPQSAAADNAPTAARSLTAAIAVTALA